MFLHARQIIRRRLKAAALKAREAAVVAVEAPAAKADGVLAQLAIDEAATMEKVRAHFAARAQARQAEILAARAAAEAEELAGPVPAADHQALKAAIDQVDPVPPAGQAGDLHQG